MSPVSVVAHSTVGALRGNEGGGQQRPEGRRGLVVSRKMNDDYQLP